MTKFCPRHGRVIAMLLPSHVQVMSKSYQGKCHNKFSERVGPTPLSRSYEIKVHFYFRRNDHFYLLVRTSLDLTEIEHFSEIPSIVTQTGTF